MTGFAFGNLLTVLDGLSEEDVVVDNLLIVLDGFPEEDDEYLESFNMFPSVFLVSGLLNVLMDTGVSFLGLLFIVSCKPPLGWSLPSGEVQEVFCVNVPGTSVEDSLA